MRQVVQFLACGFCLLFAILLVCGVRSFGSPHRPPTVVQSFSHIPLHFHDPEPSILFPSHVCTVTAYTANSTENGGSAKTASGANLHKGGVAVSRDLKKQGWSFGRMVHIHGLGKFVINDVMGPKHRKTLDVFVATKKEAYHIGRRVMSVTLLPLDES